MSTILEEARNLQRGIFAAQCEAVASIADTFGSVMHRVANTEEVTSSRSWGEGVRSSARPVESATAEIIRGFGELPRNALHAYNRAFYGGDIADAPRERVRGDRCDSRRERTSDLEATVFSRVRREIRENNGRGALLSDFVHDIARDFDVSEESVRNLVARHFTVRGDVIRERHDTDRPDRAGVRDRLTNLGYTDIRDDVPLQLINDTADLIAFEGGSPKILCFTGAANSNDLKARTIARLQANSYSEGKSVPYIWVTDGRSDYYADVSKDAAISNLPRAGSTAEADKSGRK